ncbi:MAG: DUF357 domain-containing protein [Nanoarchaeota archaeon]
MNKLKSPDKTKTITQEKLESYFKITKQAIEIASKANSNFDIKIKEDFLDMITRYYKDAQYFKEKGEIVNAFAALNYAHGWLDAGARLKIFDVKDSRLFTV